jgi:hypothetical protein
MGNGRFGGITRTRREGGPARDLTHVRGDVLDRAELAGPDGRFRPRPTPLTWSPALQQDLTPGVRIVS